MKKLLIFLLICALIVFLIYYFFPFERLPEKVKEKVDKCLEDNPSASESYCKDVAFFEIAIEEKDIGLCDKIKNSMIKNECIKAFK